MAKLTSLFILGCIVAHIMIVSGDPVQVKRKMTINNAAVNSGVLYSQFAGASQSSGNYEEDMNDGEHAVGTPEEATTAAGDAAATDATSEGAAAEATSEAAGAEATTAKASGVPSGRTIKKPLTRSADAPQPENTATDAQFPEDDSPCIDGEKLGAVNVDSVTRILKSKKGVYIPFCNYEGYELLNQMQSGQPLGNETELTNFCAHAVFTSDSITLHTVEGKFAKVMDCIKTESGLAGACKPNKGKSDHESEYNIWISKYTVVWTDDDKNVLIVICLSNEKSIWAVFSSQKTIDGTTEDTVLDKVGQLGLSKERPFGLNYEGCKM